MARLFSVSSDRYPLWISLIPHTFRTLGVNVLEDGSPRIGDVILFHDLTDLPDMQIGGGRHFCGFLHEPPKDLLIRRLKAVDLILVPSMHVKRLVTESGWSLEEGAHVRPLSFPRAWPKLVPVFPKKRLVVFAHPLMPNKRPDLFGELEECIVRAHPQWEFRRISRTQPGYYETLGSAYLMVSTAEEENWPAEAQEALMLGCIPLVPNWLSYPEYIPWPCLYPAHDIRKLSEMVGYMVRWYESHLPITGFTKMPVECLELSRQNVEHGVEMSLPRLLNIMRDQYGWKI